MVHTEIPILGDVIVSMSLFGLFQMSPAGHGCRQADPASARYAHCHSRSASFICFLMSDPYGRRTGSSLRHIGKYPLENIMAIIILGWIVSVQVHRCICRFFVYSLGALDV